MNQLKLEFEVARNSKQQTETNRLVQDLEATLILKFEDLRRKAKAKDNLAEFKRILGKTVEFLAKVRKLRKQKDSVDLETLERCRQLAGDADLGEIEVVQKEAQRVNSLHQERVSRHSDQLERALAQESEQNVLR